MDGQRRFGGGALGVLLAAAASAGAGVSGAVVGVTFERYRPMFLGVTFAFLAAAFYFAYRPRPKVAAGVAGNAGSGSCCATASVEADCCLPEGTIGWTVRRFNRAMLWPVTAVVVAFAFFPNYVGLLLGHRDSLALRTDYNKIFVAVEGMTCEACATTLEKALTAIPGVAAAEVSFKRKQASVGLPRGSDVPREKFLAAIQTAGYRGTILAPQNSSDSTEHGGVSASESDQNDDPENEN